MVWLPLQINANIESFPPLEKITHVKYRFMGSKKQSGLDGTVQTQWRKASNIFLFSELFEQSSNSPGPKFSV